MDDHRLLHRSVVYQPHINTNTMDSTIYDHAGNRYDDVNDVYTTPTDAERIAWLEGEVKALRRMIGAVGYPANRNTGGATDRQIVMGGK